MSVVSQSLTWSTILSFAMSCVNIFKLVTTDQSNYISSFPGSLATAPEPERGGLAPQRSVLRGVLYYVNWALKSEVRMSLSMYRIGRKDRPLLQESLVAFVPKRGKFCCENARKLQESLAIMS